MPDSTSATARTTTSDHLDDPDYAWTRTPNGDRSLAKLFTLDRLNADTFRGPLGPHVKARLFGGQILGQALAAAAATVPADRPPRSMHHQFIRPADATLPVEYRVEIVRDGTGHTTRAVRAFQHDKLIGTSSAAFGPIEGGPELGHAPRQPEPLPSKQAALPYPAPGVLTDFFDLRWNQSASNARTLWFRPTIDLPSDVVIHACVLLYLSDLWLIDVVLQARGLRYDDPTIVSSSLDHATWFHRPPCVVGWSALTSRAHAVSGEHGLVLADVVDQDDHHVATVVQQGLFRKRQRR